MQFTKIPSDTFKKLQLNAGVLLRSFDPKGATIKDTDIIGATTGGVKFSALPTFVDFGEDIDNCPKNMLELKKLDYWEVTMTGSFVSVDAKAARDLVGPADNPLEDTKKIVPRNDVAKTDYKDLWWVGDYGENGGFIAVHMMNTLSTGGFNLQSTDANKGAFEFTFTAHFSMDAQETVPFEIYVDSKEA